MPEDLIYATKYLKPQGGKEEEASSFSESRLS
jgi:hypothetical protein